MRPWKIVYILFNVVLVFLAMTFLISTSQTQKKLINRRNVEFHIDSTFSKKEILIIRKAFRRWEEETEGYIKISSRVRKVSGLEVFSWLSDGIPTIYNATYNLGWKRHIAKHIANCENTLGLAMIYTGDIFLLEGYSKRFEGIVTHEVGHIYLGKFHSSDINSIMYPAIGDNTTNRKITNVERYILRWRLRK